MSYFRNLVEYIAFLCIIYPLKCLPYKMVIIKVKCLFYVFGYLLGIRKQVIMTQLRLVFPDKSAKEINALTKRIYSELAITVAEVFVFGDKYFKDRSKIVGIENIEKAMSMNKGVLIVSAHFSNWELSIKTLAKLYPSVYGVVKPQRNKLFNKYLDKKRNQSGLRTIDMKNAIKYVVSALKEGGIIAFAVDQYAFKQGIEIKFLGHKTKTYTSVAQLAIKYKVPVVVAFNLRDENRQHQTIFHKMLMFDNLEYNEENILSATIEINNYIEEYILKYPHLWFWVHKKFRPIVN